MGSLKTFIKSVRGAKTIAEERAAIRKESAKIRTAFRDPAQDDAHRRKNIEKLIYLYILGEPTYFGQIECIKLLISPSYTNKRLGYMAAMLILDENQEILTLLTNSLDNDLKSDELYIVALALTTLGNIASPELAKDLYNDVYAILSPGSKDGALNKSSRSLYLRKKAAIAAGRLVKKDPDLAEVFVGLVPRLLKDKTHGNLLGALQLTKEIWANDPASRPELQKCIPEVLAHLKFLATTGYSPEYDVKGVPDPFLYVSLLQTIRRLLEGDDDSPYLEQLNDLLTQICARLEKGKGPAHAVLYEAVLTIFSLNTDSSLRVMGINILSKFLAMKDNNTRYVALNTLLSVVQQEPLAVQRHRNTIVGCLQDGDISIRRRALELTFATINEQNMRLLTKELLTFLETADEELKRYVTTQLTLAAYKYSPSMEWTFSTIVALLQVAGNHFSDEILSSILALVMQNDDQRLTKKLLQQLIDASKTSYDQFGLALVTLWCIGEYGDLSDLSDKELVDTVERIVDLSNLDEPRQRNELQLYGLTTALKLSSRIKDSAQIERLRKMISRAQNDTNLEIQIRAIEYNEIFGEPATIKKALLEKMPAPEKKTYEPVALFEGANQQPARAKAKGGNLLGMLDDEDEDNRETSQSALSNVAPAETKNTMDLLEDIFGMSAPKAPAVPAVSAAPASGNDILGDLLGGAPAAARKSSAPLPSTPVAAAEPAAAAAPAATTTATAVAVEAFSDAAVSFGLNTRKTGAGIAQYEGIVENTSGGPISGITVLCAVTKHQRLQLSAISRTSLPPGERATVHIKVTGRPGSKVKMRIKLGYESAGESVQRQFDVAMPDAL